MRRLRVGFSDSSISCSKRWMSARSVTSCRCIRTDVRRTLLTEVKKDFNVSTFTVTAATTPTDLAQAIARTTPTCVVLMNNATVALYREYQNAHHEQKMPKATHRQASTATMRRLWFLMSMMFEPSWSRMWRCWVRKS